MNVQELIEKLQAIEDKSQMIVISGYEGGVNEVTYLSDCMLDLNVNTAWYYGKHETSSTGTTPAIQLS